MTQKKAGVLLAYGGILVTMLTNLLYVPIMLRLLGQSEYGVYSLSTSVIGYMSLLYLGMTSTYLRYYSRYHRRNDQKSIAKLNALFLVLFSILGALSLIIGLTLSYNLHWILGSGLTSEEYDLAKILFIIMSFNMAILMPKTVFATLVMAQERFIFIKGLEVVRSLSVPCITLPILYYGFGSVGMGLVVLAVTFVDLVCNIWYCFHRLACPFSFRQLPLHLLPGMATFSFFIFLQGLMDQLNWHLGKLLLANFADSAAIAVYTIGLQIDLLFITFSTAFSGVVMPQIYALVQAKEKKGLSALWIQVGRYQFYVICFIWLGFLLYGQPFIHLWAGDGYEDAYIVALLLMTPIVIHLSQGTAQEILRAYNRHGQYVIVHFLFAVVGFVLCIPLTKSYGVLGVAVGTSITSFLVTMIYDNWYYAKAAHLDVMSFFRGMLKFMPAVFLCAFAGVGINEMIFMDSWRDFLRVGALYTVSYGVIMYFIGMNEHEKKLVKKVIVRCRE